jgi:hypothetical protein
VGQVLGQQSASSKELVVEQPVTPLDTISGADARLVLDAPFYYHWPSGEPACRGSFCERWAACAWVAAPCRSQCDPRRLLCSRRLAGAARRPDLAEDTQWQRVNTRQGRSAAMHQPSCICIQSWRSWFTALCTLVALFWSAHESLAADAVNRPMCRSLTAQPPPAGMTDQGCDALITFCYSRHDDVQGTATRWRRTSRTSFSMQQCDTAMLPTDS